MIRYLPGSTGTEAAAALRGIAGLLILLTVVPGTRGLRAQSPPGNARAASAASGREATHTGATASVRSAGAVGDGRADDTAAVEAAFRHGGTIVLEPGVYRLTRTVEVLLDRCGPICVIGGGVATLVMDGPGPALRLNGTHTRSADPAGVEPRVWQRQRMPLIDGLVITGKHSAGDGLEVNGTMQLTVTRCHFRRLRHAIHLVGNNRNLIVANCHIYENRGVGIFYDRVNLHQSNVTGCHISYCDQGGIVCRGGNVRNLQVSGCDLESNMAAGQEPTANIWLDSRNSKYGIAEVAITGCTIQHQHGAADSANIRVFGRSMRDQGTKVSREGMITVAGNVLSDVQVNIHLKDCRGVAISGNTAWRGYRHAALVEGCENVVIGPNMFGRRSPHLALPEGQVPANSVLLDSCRDCTLSGLHLADARGDRAGLELRRCERINVTGCTVLNCVPQAMLFDQVTRSRVSGCLFDQEAPTDRPLATQRNCRENQFDFPVHTSGGRETP